MMQKATFSDLSLDERLLKAIGSLNYQLPTNVQLETIPKVLAGKDLLVSTATGTGKTSAYVLPVLQRMIEHNGVGEGTRALILAPTRELAQQIFKYCDKLSRFTHIKTGLITGGSDFKYQNALLRKDPEIIVATPGRVLEHMNKKNTLFSNLEFLVIDEADRMLDMGLSDDVMLVCNSCADSSQKLMFSATLNTAAVSSIAEKILTNPEMVSQGSKRGESDSISQEIVLADNDGHKIKLLFWILENEPHNKVIVFSNTRNQVDQLCGALTSDNRRVNVLHGEIRQDERNETMAMFRHGNLKILVATDVAARGLDVSQVDLIINYNLPDNADDYVHRIGRTGRAGSAGRAISLVCENDWSKLVKLEKYLKRNFHRRTITSLKGHFQGRNSVQFKDKDKPESRTKIARGMKTRGKNNKSKIEQLSEKNPNTNNNIQTKKRKGFSAKNKKPTNLVDGFAPFKKK